MFYWLRGVAQGRLSATPCAILWKAYKYVGKFSKNGVWHKVYFVPHPTLFFYVFSYVRNPCKL